MRAARSTNIWKNLDWITIGLFLLLMLLGWLNIYGASYTFDSTSIIDFSNRAGKQFHWMLGTIALAIVLLLIDHKTYDILAYIAYGAMILLLLATPVLAHNIKGSMSWISIGPVNLQPAEFAKCVVALAVAKYMGRYEYKIRTWRDMIVPFALIGVPMLIIMVWQKETGSALVFLAFLLAFYRQGMSGYVLWVIVAVVALFITSIRWGDQALPVGTGNVGLLACMLILTVVEIYFLCKEHRMRYQPLILVGSVIGIYAIFLLLCIWKPMPFNWISMGVVLLLVLYNIGISIYWRKFKLLILAAFTLFCMGYTLAC